MNPRRTITLLQINDTHGYLEPHPELFWVGAQAEYRSAGGARAVLRSERRRQRKVGALPREGPNLDPGSAEGWAREIRDQALRERTLQGVLKTGR